MKAGSIVNNIKVCSYTPGACPSVQAGIMTSHVHMIIGSQGDRLENIMRDMKRHTSENYGKLSKVIQPKAGGNACPIQAGMLWLMERAGKKNSNNISFQLWRQDNHPIELNDLTKAHATLDYIHNNPIVSGIVEKPEEYRYSSARNYHGLSGLIDSIEIEPLVG